MHHPVADRRDPPELLAQPAVNHTGVPAAWGSSAGLKWAQRPLELLPVAALRGAADLGRPALERLPHSITVHERAAVAQRVGQQPRQALGV